MKKDSIHVYHKTDQQLLQETVEHLHQHSRFHETKQFIQHGTTSVYSHSIKVARNSLRLVNRLHLKVDKASLVRGALLHDYFLYDWHDKSDDHRLHGFTHPRRALENAKKCLSLNEREEDMILRHMFPLTPIPPKYKESWILCLVDKLSSIEETIGDRKKMFRSRMKKIMKWVRA